jgi:hypothetical protein
MAETKKKSSKDLRKDNMIDPEETGDSTGVGDSGTKEASAEDQLNLDQEGSGSGEKSDVKARRGRIRERNKSKEQRGSSSGVAQVRKPNLESSSDSDVSEEDAEEARIKLLEFKKSWMRDRLSEKNAKPKQTGQGTIAMDAEEGSEELVSSTKRSSSQKRSNSAKGVKSKKVGQRAEVNDFGVADVEVGKRPTHSSSRKRDSAKGEKTIGVSRDAEFTYSDEESVEVGKKPTRRPRSSSQKRRTSSRGAKAKMAHRGADLIGSEEERGVETPSTVRGKPSSVQEESGFGKDIGELREAMRSMLHNRPATRVNAGHIARVRDYDP